MREELQRSTAQWATEVRPWECVVEKIRGLFGEVWAAVLIANVGAGIRSKAEKYPEASRLLDRTCPLVQRTRHARLRSGNAVWWAKQFDGVEDKSSQMIVALVFLSWAGPSVLTSVVRRLDEVLAGLACEEWEMVSRSYRSCLMYTEKHRTGEITDIATLPDQLSDRTVAALGVRSSASAALSLYQKYLAHYEGDDHFVLSFAQDAALRSAPQDVEQWKQCLSIISRSYIKGVVSDRSYLFRAFRSSNQLKIPLEIARMLVESPDKYPSDFVNIADARCREELASAVVPVAQIAETGKWFAV